MKISANLSFKQALFGFILLLCFASCKKDSNDVPSDQNPISNGAGTGVSLDNPAKKEIAMQLVSSAENSTLDWKSQYAYIQDIKDGRGYTAGIIGFTSGTGDMLSLVTAYTVHVPGNVLAKYIPALQSVNGSDSHNGLDPAYTSAWKTAANDPKFKSEQENERDQSYFLPAIKLAKNDGLSALGQFIYYDAAIVHGYQGLEKIRNEALKLSSTPSNGGNETAYLNTFLDKRVLEMKKEPEHNDVSRIEDAQRVFLKKQNFDLNTPLNWKVYGDAYQIN